MPSRRPAVWAAVTAALGTALGWLLVARVPPGLPYDEPAHWTNVLYYAHEHRMPVLGDPGVPYEAQMGPVYYTLSAVLVTFVGGDERSAFTVLRAAGVVLVPVLAYLTYRLGRSLGPDPLVAVTAAAVVALNPLMLAIAASVQNDYLSFVLIAVVLLAGIRLVRDRGAGPLAHGGVGVLAGVAVLTKVVALVLLPALLVAYACSSVPARRRLAWAAALLAGFALTAGWWFARNLLLYGDLTGASGLDRMGVSFPPLRFHGIGDVAGWAGSVVSYVYAPVEYYRNLVKTPAPLRVVALLLALVTLLALGAYLVRTVRTRSVGRLVLADPGRALAAALLVTTVLAWFGYAVLIWNVPARLAFHAAAVVAVVFAVATRHRPGVALRLATLVTFGLVSAWLAVVASGVDTSALLTLG